MEIIWHGHSCFEIVEDDYHIVIDPYEPNSVGPAFPILNLEADELLISHDHRDHNYAEAVKLRQGRKSPFTITTMETYHDPLKGRLRGMNTVHIIEANGVRAVHLGDLGVTPDKEQIEQLKGCDVLMIPIGGILTIEPNGAFLLTEMIMPRVAIPMHYKVPGHVNWRLWDVKDYTGIFTEQPILPVKEYDVSSITVTKDTEPQVAVLRFPGEEWQEPNRPTRSLRYRS